MLKSFFDFQSILNQKVGMPLINNTVVFLDTGFFREIRTDGDLHADFFQYAKGNKIRLCTSEVCLEEYRTFRLETHSSFIRKMMNDRNSTANKNPFADHVLAMYPLPEFPNDTDTEELSIRWLADFVADNQIENFEPTPEHMKRSMWSFFRGKPPFSGLKIRKDIPDSWVYEAARDLKDNPAYSAQVNRFCIGGDNNLNGHLKGLGLVPIKTVDLVEKLKQEEAAQAAQVAGATMATIVTTATTTTVANPSVTAEAGTEEGTDPVVTPNGNTLNGILASALSEEQRQIYLRVMGYVSWLDKPAKDDLVEFIVSRGHAEQMVRAACAFLSEPTLGLITDSGKHYLATNEAILEQAAERIMPEILEFLDT